MTDGPVLAMRDITKDVRAADGRHLRILDGADLTVSRGESVAIRGPSGSGKSTLLGIAGLLDRPTSGTYSVDDEDALALPERRLAHLRASAFGFVFQRFCLMAHLTALENVTARLLHAGRTPRRERRRQATELLDAVGLADRAHHRPGRLSGGEQQRVAIARALAGDPTVVLADEPTGSLDVETGQAVLDLLLAAARDRGAALVLVTHDVTIAARLDRVVELRAGRVTA